MGDVRIELKDVYKSYKKQEVLRGVSASFEKGRSYGIMGYNGSGKSVLLKVMTGYAFADRGEVIIDGKVLKKDIDFIQNAGIIINAPEFMNGTSAMDNLRFLAEIRGVIGDTEIEEILKTMGLYEARKKRVGIYSQGMKQRLRLAQALMESPEILILDEPLNALDKEGIHLVKDLLKKYVAQGNTLIFTSHSKEELNELSDEIYEIDQGKLIKNPETVI